MQSKREMNPKILPPLKVPHASNKKSHRRSSSEGVSMRSPTTLIPLSSARSPTKSSIKLNHVKSLSSTSSNAVPNNAVAQEIKSNLARVVRGGKLQAAFGEEAEEIVERLSEMYAFSFGEQDTAYENYNYGVAKKDVELYSRVFGLDELLDIVEEEQVLHFKATKTKKSLTPRQFK